MGIENLNQHFTGRPVTLEDLRGRSFAIDGHTFLHKAGQTYARELLLKKSITEIANEVGKWVNQFIEVAEHVILVFDGAYLPAKRPTNEKRSEMRQAALKEASTLFGEQQLRLLEESVSFSFDQVKEIAELLIHKFETRNFYCFLAPFEADAQLAFLSNSNIVDVIVTLDSDIYLYGVNAVLFNYNFVSNEGKLVENCQNDLFNDIFSLRKCCILSGCDYIGSIRGIGLKKAQEAILEAKTLVKAQEVIRKGKQKEFPEEISAQEYVWRLIEALFVFQYMRIYDPIKGEIIALNKMEGDAAIYQVVGDIIGEEESLENVHENSREIQRSIDCLRNDLEERYIGQIACCEIIEHEGLDVAMLRERTIKAAATTEVYRRDPRPQYEQNASSFFRSVRNSVLLE